MMRNSTARGLLGVMLVGLFLSGTTAHAIPAYHLGLEMDVLYSNLDESNKTVDVRVTADFSSATTDWIGDTMDAFSIQYGGNSSDVLADFTSTISSPATNTAGTWTGVRDKTSANGCDGNFMNALCYTVSPTGQGGDGATIIAAQQYYWDFSVMFGSDIPSVQDLLSQGSSWKFLSLKEKPNPGWTTGSQLSETGTGTVKVPEPPTLTLLLGGGLIGLGMAYGRKQPAV